MQWESLNSMWVVLCLQPELFAWDKHIDEISAPHFDIDPRTDTEGLGQLNFELWLKGIVNISTQDEKVCIYDRK